MTGTTFFGDYFSSSSTGSTFTLLFHDTEDGLHTFTNLPTSSTCITGSSSSSFSMTGITGDTSFVFYFSHISSYRILEGYSHLYFYIFSYVRAFSPTTAPESSSEK
jgi:hypothetical protein